MTRPPRLRVGTPVWLHSGRGRGVRHPFLRGESLADVAIISGGITGSVVAEELAGAGVRVTVLEAGRVGRQSTAASTALLLQEPDQGLAELARRYGPAASRRIWELSSEAARSLVSKLQRHEIDCDLVELDTIF